MSATFDTKLTSIQQLSKETIIWRHLAHPNLLPLYGVSTSIRIPGLGSPSPCLVSPWMENGNIRDFARKNPTFNRFDLVSISHLERLS